MEDATALGHPWTLSLTLIFASMLAVDLGEGDRLQGYAETMAGIGIETRPNRLHARAIGGAALAHAGQPVAGIAEIRAAIEECGPVDPAPGFRSTLWRLLVGAHAVGGPAVAGGLAACDDALRITGSRIWWPDIEDARRALTAAAP